MKIDAHIHFWQLARNHNIWISRKIFGLQRDFTPQMLSPLLDDCGLDGVILVQAAADENETQYMLQLAKELDLVKGVIGWANLEMAPEALEAELEGLKSTPKFCGLRAHPHREFDDAWLSSDAVRQSYRILCSANVPVDFLVNCTQIAKFTDVLNDVPELTAVLNHGGRPFVMTGDTTAWRLDMQRLANETNAWVKVSGLAERAGVEWTIETLRPWIEAMIEDFGCGRLIFASNWPVMTLMSTYERWWDALNDIVEGMGVPGPDKDLLFGQNAARAYGLSAP